MADYFYARIDHAQLCQHLAELTGQKCSRRDADQWLRENGFEPVGAVWRVDSVDVAELLPDEIVTIVPEEELHGEPGDSVAAAPPGSSLKSLFEEFYRPGRSPSGTCLLRPDPPPLQEDRIRRLRALPNYDQCLIPRSTLGDHRVVKRKWDSTIRKAVRAGSWEEVVRHEQFVHIDELVDAWIMTEPTGIPQPRYDATDARLYTIWPQFFEESFTGNYGITDPEYQRFRAMILEGVSSFWFALVFLTNGFHWLPETPRNYHPDRVNFVRECAAAILPWWLHVSGREDRLVSSMWCLRSWPRWGVNLEFYSLLGVPIDGNDLKRMSAAEAGALLERAVAK